MKNSPVNIFLQTGTEDNETDFNECDKESITWSEHRINDSDIEYILSPSEPSSIPVVDTFSKSMSSLLLMAEEHYTAGTLSKKFHTAINELYSLSKCIRK